MNCNPLNRKKRNQSLPKKRRHSPIHQKMKGFLLTSLKKLQINPLPRHSLKTINISAHLKMTNCTSPIRTSLKNTIRFTALRLKYFRLNLQNRLLKTVISNHPAGNKTRQSTVYICHAVNECPMLPLTPTSTHLNKLNVKMRNLKPVVKRSEERRVGEERDEEVRVAHEKR